MKLKNILLGTILTVGIVVIILMGLFPPWTSTEFPFFDYAFIAIPPDFGGIVLDIPRLVLQWIVVLLATGLGVFLSGKSNRNN